MQSEKKSVLSVAVLCAPKNTHCNLHRIYDTYLVLCTQCLTCQLNKNTQGYCRSTKDSICYNLPLHTHDENHFHHPQILKLSSGTHTKWILNRDKKHNEIYQKVTKK